MSMKLFIFSLFSICLLMTSPLTLAAEGSPKDTVITQVASSYKYDKRIHKYRKGWSSLIPTHTTLQYAGSIGFISAGFGWDYGKHSQWETTVLLGYLPKYNSDSDKITFTIKQNFTPWNITLNPQMSIDPLTCGLFFNSIFNEDFWVNEPNRYPDGYYGFSTRIRSHIFIGQRFTYEINSKKRFFAKSITAYYELSTADLYIISAFTNRYLKPTDTMSLAFGIKMQIF